MLAIWPSLQSVRSILRTLRAARISAGLIALGCAALTLEQGLDVVRSLVENANRHIHVDGLEGQGWRLVLFQWAAFVLACMWSGLNAWYWPRILYRLTTTAPTPQWLRIVLRTLGLFPLVTAVLALARVALSPGASGARDVWIGLSIFIAATVALATLFVYRGDIFSGAMRWYNRPSWLLNARQRRGGRAPSLTRGDDAFFLVSLGLGVVMVTVLCVPGLRTTAAMLLGSAALAFGAIGILIAVLSALAWVFGRVKMPVAPVLLVTFALFSCTNDNHDVRLLGRSDDAGERPDMRAALAAWERANPDPSAPLILVAAAGGASRAGYWTGAVLRSLDERTNGLFGSRVFAISSVSGGALGAMGYAARIADAGAAGPGRCYDAGAAREFDRAFLGGDYLAPAVGGLLYPDLLQRFWPLPWFPDRATALEEGWELGWRRAAREPEVAGSPCAPRANSNLMAGDYGAIWRDSLLGRRGWVPLVLVNGTLVEDGKRVITAPVRVDARVFEDAHDFFELVGRRVRASTAISNGARFPVVSPAGTLVGASGPRGRIVDGGYFENGGLETMLDLARFLRVARPGRRIILLEVDNGLPDDAGPLPADFQRYAHDADPRDVLLQRLDVQQPPTTGAPMLSEVTSIVGGLYQTRTSRGVLAAKRLSGVNANGLGPAVSRVTFNLPRLGAGAAMSWSLSLASRRHMDALLRPARPGDLPRMGGRLVACQRAVADQLAAAVAGRAAPRSSRCPARTREAAAVGYPLPIAGVPGP
ncbi:hypothetical protein [Novosphingobium sp. 9U]|uniref:hypothetical protein n=1 Tax=Novosphingobium sp. 9U TaxID=2653158 RepID=UPI0012F2D498|nr:hypothetical protein [Novosphingobium sp. 9U]VWX50874.1 conserved membrane hypothetical protein [Novosphingobium sp. 9U]